ncbi:MAG: NAD(P)/FAD-dependent oxidoreductase [Thermoanaerobaculales bacterium]|jgi:protoporphyrinogen oxidase|nr:NAD(P)/FAD-dependent oxidoreductase [Thermoanaerobaculales bacterium]
MNDIAIVGAGLAGLTAALRLTQAGYRVRLFERYPKPGGLARALEIGGEPLEAFYHHIFTTDTDYVELAAELGLDGEIEWLPSKMGIWTDGRLWNFGTPLSLLRFKPMRLVDKLRFGLSTVLLQRHEDPTPFESVTAAEWIRRHQGERAWRTVWGPLFHQKFAEDAENVAMVWLWRKLSLRGRSRSKSGMGERLGYMRGSFVRLVEELARRIESNGGSFHLTEEVRRVDTDGDLFSVITRRETYPAGKVLVAAPIPDHLAVAGGLLSDEERQSMERLRATGALCTILELSESLTPYYWLNIADPEMPFGGLIEHTNYIPPDRYGGRVLLYISNYVFTDHPLFRASKSKVIETYLPHLQRVNPRFDETWILASHHFRADYAQPVVTTGYRDLIPDMRTSIPGLYLCSMAQIFPEDRGQNYAIAYGEKVAELMLEDLEG